MTLVLSTFEVDTPAPFSKRNLLSRATSGLHLSHDWVSGQEKLGSRAWKVVVGGHQGTCARPSGYSLLPANPHLAPLSAP